MTTWGRKAKRSRTNKLQWVYSHLKSLFSKRYPSSCLSMKPQRPSRVRKFMELWRQRRKGLTSPLCICSIKLWMGSKMYRTLRKIEKSHKTSSKRYATLPTHLNPTPKAYFNSFLCLSTTNSSVHWDLRKAFSHSFTNVWVIFWDGRITSTSKATLAKHWFPPSLRSWSSA